jgi:hypothetical protein
MNELNGPGLCRVDTLERAMISDGTGALLRGASKANTATGLGHRTMHPGWMRISLVPCGIDEYFAIGNSTDSPVVLTRRPQIRTTIDCNVAREPNLLDTIVVTTNRLGSASPDHGESE